MCEDFTSNTDIKRTGCCIRITHHLSSSFSRAFLTKNNITVVPHPPYTPDLGTCDFSLFLRLKIKLKGRHFDKIEVIKAELHAVLNTVTEHDFQDTFKK
jgi:hypothetical protein